MTMKMTMTNMKKIPIILAWSTTQVTFLSAMKKIFFLRRMLLMSTSWHLITRECWCNRNAEQTVLPTTKIECQCNTLWTDIINKKWDLSTSQMPFSTLVPACLLGVDMNDRYSYTTFSPSPFSMAHDHSWTNMFGLDSESTPWCPLTKKLSYFCPELYSSENFQLWLPQQFPSIGYIILVPCTCNGTP